jgi:hypothetical protein
MSVTANTAAGRRLNIATLLFSGVILLLLAGAQHTPALSWSGTDLAL